MHIKELGDNVDIIANFYFWAGMQYQYELSRYYRLNTRYQKFKAITVRFSSTDGDWLTYKFIAVRYSLSRQRDKSVTSKH